MKWRSVKWLLFIAALSVAQGADVTHPELAEIKTVYLLPMTFSLDQFLAIRLTKGGVVQVAFGSETLHRPDSESDQGSKRSKTHQYRRFMAKKKVMEQGT